MRRLMTACVAASLACACSVLTSLDQLAPTDAGAGADVTPAFDASSDTLTTQDTGGNKDSSSKPYVFFDDFKRSAIDGGLGNAWVSKDVSFELSNDMATRLVTNDKEYLDNIQTRPIGESVADVEVSVELVLPSVAPCSPQIHARVDTGTVQFPNDLDSYIFFLDNDGKYVTWVVGRQHGGQVSPDPIDTVIANAPVQAGVPLRLTLRVQGSNPVVLFASVESKVNNAWQLLGSVMTSDTTGLALTKAGVVGFGAGKGMGYETSGEYSYDNFSAKGL